MLCMSCKVSVASRFAAAALLSAQIATSWSSNKFSMAISEPGSLAVCTASSPPSAQGIAHYENPAIQGFVSPFTEPTDQGMAHYRTQSFRVSCLLIMSQSGREHAQMYLCPGGCCGQTAAGSAWQACRSSRAPQVPLGTICRDLRTSNLTRLIRGIVLHPVIAVIDSTDRKEMILKNSHGKLLKSTQDMCLPDAHAWVAGFAKGFLFAVGMCSSTARSSSEMR